MVAVPLSNVAVRLRPEDNVAVAARPLAAGIEIDVAGKTIALDKRIGLGHKFALSSIRSGSPILKYGQIIGFAGSDIEPGSHVHVHNVRADVFERDYAFCRDKPALPPRAEPRYFSGYDRGPDRPAHL